MSTEPQNTSLIKVTTGLSRIEKQMAITNKLLATIDPVLIPYRKKDKWGFCTPDKEIVIECKYKNAEKFSEGLAVVYLNGSGYINKEGEVVIPLEFGWGRDFSEGLAAVEINKKWGFINKMGKVVIPFQYESADQFSEELAEVQLNGKWGYINKSDKIIIPFKYGYSAGKGFFSNGLAPIHLEGKYAEEENIAKYTSYPYGFVNKVGKCIIPFKYSSITKFSEGLAAVELNGKCGYINEVGEIVIPFKYDKSGVCDWGKFSEEFAAVSLNGKVGYINKVGEIIISFKYDSAHIFTEGLAAVKSNAKWGYINKTGEIAIPYKYDTAWEFSEGLAPIKLNGKWGFINKIGEIIIPFKYGDLIFNKYFRGFEGGLAKVKLNEGAYNMKGYINKSGTEYWED